MKALFTAAVAGLAGVTAMMPAGASTTSIGNSAARDCWQAAEARDKGQTGYGTDDEVDLLTVHGILHLLGYDHAEPEEHREMFGLQARLLAEWQGARRGETLPGDEPGTGRP